MITLAQYWMGRDALYPTAMSPAIARSALTTIDLANRLLTLAKGAGILVHDTPEWGAVASGWRPPAVNAVTKGAAVMSKHMTGEAIDLFDPDGSLDRWLMLNQKVLKDLGLWLEHPDATPRWCHVQTIPPHSGNRVFVP